MNDIKKKRKDFWKGKNGPFLVAEIFKICLLTFLAKKIIKFRKL